MILPLLLVYCEEPEAFRLSNLIRVGRYIGQLKTKTFIIISLVSILHYYSASYSKNIQFNQWEDKFNPYEMKS